MTRWRLGFMQMCLAILLVVATSPASALNILVTNDDGYDSLGITTLKNALVTAGHTVTIVAPFDEQSGRGGAVTTDRDSDFAVAQWEATTWSVDGTPSDAVRVALDGILVGNPPDLVISGMNAGQNLGMTGSVQSGTVNAALAALERGIPSIAVSVERIFESVPVTTDAAYPKAADFIVRLVDKLILTAYAGYLIPAHHMINVNIPVPYEDGNSIVAGVWTSTNLAERSSIDFLWAGDPTVDDPAMGDKTDPLDPYYGALVLGSMSPDIDFAWWLGAGGDPVPNNDTDRLRANYITITLMDGDMTAKQSSGLEQLIMSWRLSQLQP